MKYLEYLRPTCLTIAPFKLLLKYIHAVIITVINFLLFNSWDNRAKITYQLNNWPHALVEKYSAASTHLMVPTTKFVIQVTMSFLN